MTIVNFINAHHTYIILSIIPQDIQNIVLGPALAIFMASFIFSIMFLLKENHSSLNLPRLEPVVNTWPTPHVDRMTAKESILKPEQLRQSLFWAFYALENAKELVSNLEDLKSKSIIDEESYIRNKEEYNTMTATALSSIASIKTTIKDELESRKKSLSDLQSTIQATESGYLSKSVSKAQYQLSSRNLRKDMERIEGQIAVLQALFDTGGTYDATSRPD